MRHSSETNHLFSNVINPNVFCVKHEKASQSEI
jgi:hypothetical protein